MVATNASETTATFTSRLRLVVSVSAALPSVPDGAAVAPEAQAPGAAGVYNFRASVSTGHFLGQLFRTLGQVLHLQPSGQRGEARPGPGDLRQVLNEGTAWPRIDARSPRSARARDDLTSSGRGHPLAAVAAAPLGHRPEAPTIPPCATTCSEVASETKGTNPEVLEVSGKRDSWTQTENESPRRWPSRRSSSAASTNRPEPLGLLSGPARRTKKNQVTHHVAVEPSVPAFTSYAKLKQSGGLGTVKSLRRKRRPPPNRSSRPDAAQANIPYCPYQKATESCRSHNVCRSVITAGASQQRSLVAPLFKRPQFPPPEIPLEWQGSERSKWDDSAATLLNLTVTFLQKLPKNVVEDPSNQLILSNLLHLTTCDQLFQGEAEKKAKAFSDEKAEPYLLAVERGARPKARKLLSDEATIKWSCSIALQLLNLSLNTTTNLKGSRQNRLLGSNQKK